MHAKGARRKKTKHRAVTTRFCAGKKIIGAAGILGSGAGAPWYIHTGPEPPRIEDAQPMPSPLF